jgi:hypothetical protein
MHNNIFTGSHCFWTIALQDIHHYELLVCCVKQVGFSLEDDAVKKKIIETLCTEGSRFFLVMNCIFRIEIQSVPQ